MEVKLIESMADDLHVIRAAKVSTQGVKSLDKQGSTGLINYLIRERHASPFEHSTFTFYIHAPIFVTREILRHRWSSINEESGRYKVLDPEFYYPDSTERPLKQIGKTGAYEFELGEELRDDTLSAFSVAYDTSWETYQSLLDLGVAKEVARMVLPLGIYSSLYLTVNARALINFLSLRLASNAQWEIRWVAEQMRNHFKEQMPITYTAWAFNGKGSI